MQNCLVMQNLKKSNKLTPLHCIVIIMSGIFTPQNQVKLTNVSVVRLKKAGKRFELACYKNKVVDYRNRTTKDLDQVLQIKSVFVNVSKGQLAKKEDLAAAFGPNVGVDQIIVEILEKGELQVGEKERDVQMDTLFKEIVNIISGKCVNPSTRTPYPPALIEKALSTIHFSANPKKSAKQQALECIRQLSASKEFPIARARMRLVLEAQESDSGLIKQVEELASEVESKETVEAVVKLSILIEPLNYRKLSEIVVRHNAQSSTHTALLRIESLREVKEQEANYL